MERRIDGGEARHRMPRHRVGGAGIVVKELLASEDRTLDDGEVVAVLRDLPHLFEPRQRPRVVLLEMMHRPACAQLAVERERVAHCVDGERVVFDHAPGM